ncbi:MAG: hypothetical protein K2P74_04000 [Nitrosomonas sp.]|nr:hypothetical protein [Nitrosomonas sp.]
MQKFHATLRPKQSFSMLSDAVSWLQVATFAFPANKIAPVMVHQPQHLNIIRVSAMLLTIVAGLLLKIVEEGS